MPKESYEKAVEKTWQTQERVLARILEKLQEEENQCPSLFARNRGK